MGPTYVWMYVCMHACMYVCMHLCMYACMYACMYVCMYVCIHIMYTHTHTHLCSNWGRPCHGRTLSRPTTAGDMTNRIGHVTDSLWVGQMFGHVLSLFPSPVHPECLGQDRHGSSGCWFGTSMLFSHMGKILSQHIPTDELIFFRGWLDHQPVECFRIISGFHLDRWRGRGSAPRASLNTYSCKSQDKLHHLDR